MINDDPLYTLPAFATTGKSTDIVVVQPTGVLDKDGQCIVSKESGQIKGIG